jgi:hypothetical protein
MGELLRSPLQGAGFAVFDAFVESQEHANQLIPPLLYIMT